MKIEEFKKPTNEAFAGLRGMFSGQGTFQTQVQDIFIRDFMQDALVSLNNGIKGGLVSTVASPDAAPAKPVEPATTAASAPAVQKMTPRDLNIAKAQNKVAPGTATGTAPAARMTPRERLMLQRQAKAVKESQYEKLDSLFESIIAEMDGSGQMSISQYLTTWFSKYMQGVNWTAGKTAVEAKIAQIEKEYPNNLKKNLKELGSTALALSKADQQHTPAGAPPQYKKSSQANQTAPTQLKAALDNLAKTNPQAYNELLKTLRPAS
jgi:hypothetical protein